MKKYIQSILYLTLGIALAGCGQELVNPAGDSEFAGVPAGEMAFCVGAQDLSGNSLTKGMVPGEEYTAVTSLQLICFDKSGYYLGLRNAYPTPDSGSQPTTGTFSGFVPESTARIHFLANLSLDLSAYPIGTAEKVILDSEALSTRYDDIDKTDPSSPKLCFWGYHKEVSAVAMKAWLQAATPNTVSLLRDRARIKLTVSNTLYNGGWQANSAGSGKKITSIKWGVNNGRERGYLAPAPSSWDGYSGGTIVMNEYERRGRYILSESELDAFDPAGNNYQYVFDDSNMKTSSENGRITIVLEVNYENNGGGGAGTKYLLAQLREGSGLDEGEMVRIVRNSTYAVNITNLAHDGYSSFDQAVNPDADDFTNAPADVDITVPYITDGHHILNLLSPKPVVVARTAGQEYTVLFEYTKDDGESDPAVGDFRIYWEENTNSGWTSSSGGEVGSDLTKVSTSGKTTRWSFTVKIGTIGSSYTFTDHLVIRHKKSGLNRAIHFYAVEHFLYRLNPVLEQVMVGPDPYLGPSGDDTGRPVFRLRFKLSQSLQEDLFPITVRIASSTLEPYGDKSTSHTARLSGGFAVLNASTATSVDGTSLASSDSENDWNYKSNTWNYWYGYTLNEYPKTGEVWDGEVVIYLKDIRDAYAQASNQGVGLYLDVANFEPKALYLASPAIQYPSYPYTEGASVGEYRVGSVANKYRATVTGAEPGVTYTLSEEISADWLAQNPVSVTADASGNLDVRFSVTANSSGERNATIVFTNSSNPGKTSKLTVIQASGMDALFRVKAENTSVMGNTREVKLTVYSDADWTLSSVSDGAENGAFSLSSGNSTGNGGIPVKFTMPVNYSTSDDVHYTITLTKVGSSPAVTADVVITQRKATEVVSAYAEFRAGSAFTSSYSYSIPNSATSGPRISAQFSPVGSRSYPATTGGGLLDPQVRWDFSADTWLEVSKNDDVRDIWKVEFDYHNKGLAAPYVPGSFAANTLSLPATEIPGTYADEGVIGNDNQGRLLSWTPTTPVPGVHFDLSLGSKSSFGLVYFRVYINYCTWE